MAAGCRWLEWIRAPSPGKSGVEPGLARALELGGSAAAQQVFPGGGRRGGAREGTGLGRGAGVTNWSKRPPVGGKDAGHGRANRWSVWISHRVAFLPAKGIHTGTPGMNLVAGPRKLGAWHGAWSGEGEHRTRRLLPDASTLVDPAQGELVCEAKPQSSSLTCQSRRRWLPSRAAAAIGQDTGQPRRWARPPGP